MLNHHLQVAAGLLFVALSGAAATAQTIQPPFNANYTYTSLGTPAGVPTSFGGVTLKNDDPNVLLLGGAANGGAGAIYAVPLVRDACGQISGFAGPASLYATAPNIDGGLCYNDQGILFATTYSDNQLHQYLPGATSPTRTDSFTALGMSSSTGSCNFVPAGFGGAGRFKVLIYNSGFFYDVTLTPAGNGTYNLSNPVLTAASINGGPEGFAYVPAGSPNFPVPSMIVAEWGSGNIAAYEIDGQGNPISSTRRLMISGLSGAEGAFIDPGTGDFIFATFGGGNQVVVVRGFAATSDCDSIDYNNDGSFYDPQDIDALLSVYSEGPCIPAGATCNDIDFDNNGSCFDPADIDTFLRVYSEGPCSL